jgi:iron complex outermembrane receptor protein
MDQQIKTAGKVLMVAACMVAPLHAAEITESSEPVELEVMVVTATRSAQSLADAPAAVTVVDEKKIESKNVSRLGDALDQVPSLYLQNGAFGASQGTSGTSGMSLRGIDQSRTLILLDGQPIQDASSGKVNWRIPFTDDIERIEVVPGAFSSLYGSNAIGGVINIITKQPDKREFSVNLKKGWNDLSGEDGSIYFRDTLESGLGIVAGAGYQKRDSFVNDFVVKTPSGSAGTLVTGGEAITTREGVPAYLVGDKGRTPWTSAHGTLKLSYKLDARDRVFGGVSYQETNQDYTAFNTYLRNAATGLPVSSGPVNINNEQYARLSLFDFVNNSPLYESATRYFAGYEGTTGKDTLLKVDLAKIEREYYFSFVNPADSAASLNSGRGTLTDTPNSGLDGSVQLSFPVGEKQFWVTGLALHRDEANQKIHELSNWRDPDTRTALTSGFNGTSTTTSLFAQDEITLTDKLKAYLGGRLDYWETKGDVFNTLSSLPTTAYPSRSDSAFSPKASAVYKPVEAVTLRASFGRSFRAPANLDLYTTLRSRCTLDDGSPSTCIIHSNPDLEPETGTTGEIGGDWRFTNSSQAGLTVYETRLKNLIYRNQTGTDIFRINAGKARVRGIELTARTRLSKWLELDANYAWIDSEILENVADPASVGKRLTDSPEHIAGIGLTARHGPWTGTLNARYVSHVFFTSANTDVVEGVPGSYDAYTLVNAKAGYAFSKTVKASLAINNLLDEEAYSFFLLPGRSAVAELDFNF